MAAVLDRRATTYGTPNTPNGTGLPVTVDNKSTVNVGDLQTFDRLNVRLEHGRQLRLLDNGLGPAQGVHSRQ